MSQLMEKRLEMKDMDMLSSKKSIVHSFNPLSKLLITMLYIMVVVSFPKYNFAAASMVGADKAPFSLIT